MGRRRLVALSSLWDEVAASYPAGYASRTAIQRVRYFHVHDPTLLTYAVFSVRLHHLPYTAVTCIILRDSHASFSRSSVGDTWRVQVKGEPR